MRLSRAQIGPYKSISEQQALNLEDDITVIVGPNEAGKSAILEALYKSNSGDIGKFAARDDYPKKHLAKYQKSPAEKTAPVVKLFFKLDANDMKAIKDTIGPLDYEPELEIHTTYENIQTPYLNIDETRSVAAYVNESSLDDIDKQELSKAKTFLELFERLDEKAEYTDQEAVMINALRTRCKVANTDRGWQVLENEAYKAIEQSIPSFLYFTQYNLLPGRVNIPELQRRLAEKKLNDSDRAVISLLSLADLEVNDLINSPSYEDFSAALQNFGNTVTDRILQFWKRSNELQVTFDVRSDSNADAPFNVGQNLYIRIRNLKQRVDTSFDVRSRGFIWFFSFIIWFDDAQRVDSSSPLILLLDEPGLSLHAAAQDDFLNYIEELGKARQVIYTTHSPFMIRPERLERVRVVQDVDYSGTTISSDLQSRDASSLLPLQAALGYSLAQNLFIGENNLIVEGTSDVVYLQAASAKLEELDRIYLDEKIILMPVAGIDKIPTFVSLISGNKLKLAICVDYDERNDQRFKSLIANKLIREKMVFDYSMFRNQHGTIDSPTDVEDMFSDSHYLAMFNFAYTRELRGVPLKLTELPVDTRIVRRIENALRTAGILLRLSGGFSHMRVALSSVPTLQFGDLELDAFERLFEAVNKSLLKGKLSK